MKISRSRVATYLAFSPNNKILAAGYQHRRPAGQPPDDSPVPYTLRLFDAATGKVLANLTREAEPISPVTFSPDGRILATGDGGTKITLWDLPARYAPSK